MSETIHLVERQCSECGELTLNDELCRDCSLEKAFNDARCEECGEFIFGELVLRLLGIVPRNHTSACASGAVEKAKGLAMAAAAESEAATAEGGTQ